MKKAVAAIAVVAPFLLFGLSAWYFTNPGMAYCDTPESIIFGGPPLEQSAFIYG